MSNFAEYESFKKKAIAGLEWVYSKTLAEEEKSHDLEIITVYAMGWAILAAAEATKQSKNNNET